MRTLKITLAYDGTAYAGWQVQLDQTTLQAVLVHALARLTKGPVRTLASGRTDAGVHALGQVVCARLDTPLPLEVIHRALNATLPHDMVVLEVLDVPETFHPIRDVVRKRYRYVIHDGPIRDIFARHYAWNYTHGRLDVEAMQRAAAALVGTHDFRSFASSGSDRKTTVRTIYEVAVRRVGAGEGRAGAAAREGEAPGEPCATGSASMIQDRAGVFIPGLHVGRHEPIAIDVEGNGFLYNMVRTIVGSLVDVGRGAESEDYLARVLAATDRRVAGATAPPQGLFLVKVDFFST